MALLAPEAWPSSTRRTDPRTTLATGAKKSPIPTPARMKGATSAEYDTAGDDTAASQARPAACRASPTPMILGPGTRSDSAPAIGATMTGIAVHGRTRRPEPSGE